MKFTRTLFWMVGLAAVVLSAGPALADEEYTGHRTYAVTITNLTRGQIFSPPVVFSHKYKFNLFELGEPASDQLYPLAEDGNAAPLVEYLSSSPRVFDYVTAEGPIMPGQSLTLEVNARGRFRYLTVAGMLVSTNDAFFALQKYSLPFRGIRRTTVPAYDAGSEANSELCDSIPGPPCGNGGVRDTKDAEGYVHIHGGIHGGIYGGGDLNSAQHDWRNPVAAITVKAR